MKTKVIYSLLLYVLKTDSNLLLIDSDSLIISPFRGYSCTEVADVAKHLIELGYLKGVWQKAPDGSGYTCWVNGLTQLGFEYVRKYVQPGEITRQNHEQIRESYQKMVEKYQKNREKTDQLLVKTALNIASSKKLRCCSVALKSTRNHSSCLS